MALTAKFIRTQINMLQPLLKSCSLNTIRKAQDKVGELMESRYRRQVIVKEHSFSSFSGAWIMPRDELRQGVILYLHGGGYACGGLDYAKGFGSTLSEHCGVKVFCAAYRLAPENPYPAALNDALTAYRYLLDKGYAPGHITLCGESAGGGLCYALCLQLKALGLPLPAGIVTVSPWVDLTLSGPSHEKKRDSDPVMSRELLEFFAKSYGENLKDPLLSPLFGDLTNMPPSLIFVGSDEVLLSDSESLREKLTAQGCHCQLIVREERWHSYLLYNLAEDQQDFDELNRFLSRFMCPQQKLRWLRLDNAAKIYPASRRQRWSNVFRVSATLTETVDTDLLQSALDVTLRRFPSISVRLRRGLFWYYLQQLPKAPPIRKESSCPLIWMSNAEIRKCAFRVIAYENRIAFEVFHALTDGNGALVFLKSLTAEYLQQKYGVSIPAQHGVLGRLEEPSEEELEDSFQKHAGPVNASRKETTAWRPKGTPEKDGFLNLTCFQLSAQQVLDKAHEQGVSVTAYLCAALMMALQNMQNALVPKIRRRKAIKVLVPVNLRNLFPSRSLRNFVLYTTPEIDPRLGDYHFPELCKLVHHHMGYDVTPKRMSRMIATNISSESNPVIRIIPLFLKNIVMRVVFDLTGERKSCLCMSNLGAVKLPESMTPYVRRMDFILSAQAQAPHNCSMLSYGDTLYINMVRNIRESDLEYHFFRVLQEQGLDVLVESNRE